VLGIIDAGNTQVKSAVFDGNQMVKNALFKGFNQELVRFFIENKVKNVFVSSVIEIPHEFMNEPHLTITTLNSTLKLPITNKYNSPFSLGNDRLANACGAWVANAGKGPVLSIDLGTCIKFDFVDAQNNYLGGSISPGFQMRLKALNQFTQKLPIVDINQMPQLVGTTTNESIASGVALGIVAEVDGFIEQYKLQFPAIKVFLTGGDAAFFLNSLKNNIFAFPLLTMHGLNAIAKLNGTD